MEDLVSYHECGHVVMAIYLGGRVTSVTVEPDRDDGPRRDGDVQVQWRISRMTKREFHEKCIMVALAGPVAEMIHSGDPFHPAGVAQWRHDWQSAWQSAEHLVADDRRRLRFLEETTAEIYRLFSRDEMWQAIAALADELAAHETLDEEQILDVVQTWLG
jgi:ATP-dependent Zn protease